MVEMIGQFKPGSPEWVEARRRRVGGSEAAVCLGISPFESRFSLWHRKAGMVGQIEQTPILEWGNRLESAVLGRWVDDHPGYAQVWPAPGTFVAGFMTANPDALAYPTDIESAEIIEVKTSPYGDVWGPSGSDEYPAYYRAQVLHYMHVLEITRAHLIVLISGYDYREYEIVLDAEAETEIQLIIDAEREFVDSLPGGVTEHRPDIDEHDATYQTLRELHPGIDAGETVEIDPQLASHYLTACQDVKDAEAVKREQSSRILDVMGDAQYATFNDERIASRQARGDGKPYLVAARARKKEAA